MTNQLSPANRLDHDVLMNADSQAVAEALMHLLDRAQRRTAEAQILSSAGFFIMLCERFGVEGRTALSAMTNLMNTKHGMKPEFAACRAYLENEL